MDHEQCQPLQPPPVGIQSPPPQQAGDEESVSVKPGNHDRGWNDPPVFTVEKNIEGKPVPTKLNKRVAFPLSSGIGIVPEMSGGNSITAVSPPPPVPINIGINNFSSSPVPVFTPAVIQNNSSSSGSGSVVTESETNQSNLNDSQNSKDTVMAILTASFENAPLDAKVKEDVAKRLAILESSYESLPGEVRMKVGRLTRNLQERNYLVAEQIQMSLGSEYISQCSPWIMAIKHIIRANQEH